MITQQTTGQSAGEQGGERRVISVETSEPTTKAESLNEVIQLVPCVTLPRVCRVSAAAWRQVGALVAQWFRE